MDEKRTTTKLLERRLVNTQRGIERLVVGISLRDQMKKTWIKEQTKVKDILRAVKKKQWQWTGHIYRRQDDRWTNKVNWDLNYIKRPRA